MRNLLAGAMMIIMALSILVAVILFGAVSIDLAAPVYGLVILLVVLWAAKLFLAKVVSWKQSPAHLPVLAFLIYVVVRYFTSPIEYESRLELFQIGLCTLVYFLAACNFYRQRDRSVLLGVLIVLALAESAYGMWQFATKAHSVLYLFRPAQYYQRAGGTYICPNHLAGFLEIVLGLLLARMVMHRSSKESVQQTVLQKVFIIYGALMALAGIIMTLSRGGWIATVLALLVFLLWGDWRLRSMWPRIAIALTGLAALGILALKVPTVRHYVWLTTFSGEPASNPIAIRDVSLGGRTLMWGSTIKIIRDQPLFGTGGGTWQWVHLKYRDPSFQFQAEYAHNDVLNLASDYGCVGFGLVVAAMIGFYWHVRLLSGPKNSSEQRAFAVGSAISVLAILVHSWFDFNMHIPANALLIAAIMGFTVAMQDSQERFPRTEMKPVFRFALAGFLLALCFTAAWFIAPTALAYRYTAIGNDHKEVVEWDRALDYYRRAVALDPRSPEPHSKMGDIFRSQSEWRLGPARQTERTQLAQQAVAAYQKSLALNPYRSEVLLRLAKAFEDMADNESALRTYQQALAIDPNNAFNYSRLGLFYRHINNEELARDAFEKAEKLNWWASWINRYNLEELRSKH